MANNQKTRPDYLNAIREWILGQKGIFTLEQIVREKGFPHRKVMKALYRLRQDQLLTRFVRKGVYASKCLNGQVVDQEYYRLANRKGLTKDLCQKRREGTAAERMWFIIRQKKVFTRRDLVVLAEASAENAKWYTRELRRRGIIEPVGKGGPGMEWRLANDPGPMRPSLGAGEE